MSVIKFADHSGQLTADIEDGIYEGVVKSVEFVTEADGSYQTNERGAKRVKIVIDVLDEDGNVLRPLTRRAWVSFGVRKTGEPSIFSAFLQAATGIRAGDMAQMELTSQDVVGKSLRVLVEHSPDGYINIGKFLPPAKRSGRVLPSSTRASDIDIDLSEYDIADAVGGR